MDKIPKVIHYCWFGRGKKNDLIQECMESWKKNLPDYEIIEWNEDNFDIYSNKYVEEAYRSKKWAFVSDFVRLYALYHHGGIYVDTDLEVLKSLDIFLKHEAFSGFESKDSLPTAIMGSRKKNKLIGEFLDYYSDRSFILKNGEYDLTTNVVIMTEILREKGAKMNGKKQNIDGFTIYPQKYFAPNSLSMVMSKIPATAYTIHHFDSSWVEKKSNKKNSFHRIRKYATGKLRNIMGTRTLYETGLMVKNILK